MRISSAIPQLRTTDLDASIRFYTCTLGLTLEFRHEDFYAAIRAGTQLFHLKLVDERDPTIDLVSEGEHFHLYLQTDDATAAAAQLRRDGVPLVGRHRGPATGGTHTRTGGEGRLRWPHPARA